jgi:rare lipoprotein A (peptidoglycan hydrolase)
MVIRRAVGFFVVLLVTFSFWASYSIFAKANDKKLPEKEISVYTVLQRAEGGNCIPASIYINDVKVMTFTQPAGGLSPRERARFLVLKLMKFIKNGKDPQKIFPTLEKNMAVGKYQDEILFTADINAAKAEGKTQSELAFTWANNIRKALGATELVKNYEFLKRVYEGENIDMYLSYSNYMETGYASWYGGNFHGRRAANGSRYSMYEYTAAHRSLPFGSVVKVTNLRNGSSCLVKITDRGPFVKGRIIDLSKIAAKEIGILNTGVSRVKIQVLGKV